ncbi:hypothetical protein [Cellulomonas iranensis]|uniref:hypothetical protein n=1 Tax=Cellulomonas iranensis TaxID=76862 RepID=UPI000B3CC63B|nr:hypothetical protein [Cellulomonas iranensis]
MTEPISSEDLRQSLLEVEDKTAGTYQAIEALDASEDELFLPRTVPTLEILEIYERRWRMGRLEEIPGGREFLEALRIFQGTEMLMVAIESPAGVTSVWVTPESRSVVGTLTFIAATGLGG